MFDKLNFDSIPRFDTLKYRYKYNFHKEKFEVYSKDDLENHVAVVEPNLDDTGSVVISEWDDSKTSWDSISVDYMNFMLRPEYHLPNIAEPLSTSGSRQDYYEMLFAGAVFDRAIRNNPECNPDDAWPQIDRALRWIRSTDFYTAPASSRFHDAHSEGLCAHSIRVAVRAVELMRSAKFNNPMKIGEVVFCALVHDWCKIGLYESFMKNVKNDETGVWEKVQAYRYRGDSFMNLGHGVSSMFLINKFFRLNIEEASAIRWHMGAYRTDDNEFNELQSSNENFMLVHLIQFADQLSLVKY